MSWNGPKPRYTRELTKRRGNRRGIRLMSEYYVQRRFEFYRAGFKTIRLPGPMCSPVFLAAYDIARLCQLQFTPAVKHPDLAARIKAHAMIVFETPEFERLRPQTQKRYRRWVDDFCLQIGGRCVPTMRYISMVREHRAAPTAARLKTHCREFRELLKQAIAQKPHPQGYRLVSRAETVLGSPILFSIETQQAVVAGAALLRQPIKPLDPVAEERRRNRASIHVFANARQLAIRKRLRPSLAPYQLGLG